MSDLYIAFVIGTVLSLLYCELTGILPAGLVVPGYLALVFDQPQVLVIILIISLLTYLLVTFGVAKLTILYGKRKFAAMLAMGVILKLTFDYLYPFIPFEILEFRGVGVIVPGLIANTIQKQGVFYTLSSTLLLSALSFMLLFSYNYFLG